MHMSSSEMGQAMQSSESLTDGRTDTVDPGSGSESPKPPSDCRQRRKGFPVGDEVEPAIFSQHGMVFDSLSILITLSGRALFSLVRRFASILYSIERLSSCSLLPEPTVMTFKQQMMTRHKRRGHSASKVSCNSYSFKLTTMICNAMFEHARRHGAC